MLLRIWVQSGVIYRNIINTLDHRPASGVRASKLWDVPSVQTWTGYRHFGPMMRLRRGILLCNDAVGRNAMYEYIPGLPDPECAVGGRLQFDVERACADARRREGENSWR